MSPYVALQVTSELYGGRKEGQRYCKHLPTSSQTLPARDRQANLIIPPPTPLNHTCTASHLHHTHIGSAHVRVAIGASLPTQLYIKLIPEPLLGPGLRGDVQSNEIDVLLFGLPVPHVLEQQLEHLTGILLQLLVPSLYHGLLDWVLERREAVLTDRVVELHTPECEILCLHLSVLARGYMYMGHLNSCNEQDTTGLLGTVHSYPRQLPSEVTNCFLTTRTHLFCLT